jgi:uncharacterized membrane protein YoaK (UPF0700 family)
MMQQSKSTSYYLSCLVALLVASENSSHVRGLQVSPNNNNNPSRKSNGNNNIYYTSSSRSRCHTPRYASSVKTEFKRNRIILDDVEQDLNALHTPAASSLPPLFVPYEREDLKNIRIVSLEESGYNQYLVKPTPSASPSKTSSKIPPAAAVNLACILAANSGFLNGLGLSGVLGKAASLAAVTGTYTNAAVSFSASALKPAALLAVLATPLCYLLGSLLNGLLNPKGNMAADDNVAPHLSLLESSPLMIAGGLMLLANSLRARASVAAFPFLLILTFCMGLQNSFTSNLVQGNLLRSAHFSGITSDMGTIVGQILRGNTDNAYKLPIFAKLTASFWAGGMVSVLGVQQCGLAASTCCTVSALLYFGLWSRITALENVLETVSATTTRVRRFMLYQQLRRRQKQQQQEASTARA